MILFGPAGEAAGGEGLVIGEGEFLEESADDGPAPEFEVFEDRGAVGVAEAGKFGGEAVGGNLGGLVEGKNERFPEEWSGFVGEGVELIEDGIGRRPGAAEGGSEVAEAEAFLGPTGGALGEPAVFEEGGAVLDEVEELVGGSEIQGGADAGGDGEADAEGIRGIAWFAVTLELVVGDAIGFEGVLGAEVDVEKRGGLVAGAQEGVGEAEGVDPEEVGGAGLEKEILDLVRDGILILVAG